MPIIGVRAYVRSTLVLIRDVIVCENFYVSLNAFSAGICEKFLKPETNM